MGFLARYVLDENQQDADRAYAALATIVENEWNARLVAVTPTAIRVEADRVMPGAAA